MATQQARVIALHPDQMLMGRLTLGELRSYVEQLTGFPDSTQVLYPAGDSQGGWRRPMSGGLLEVVQYLDPDGNPVTEVIP